MEACQSEDELQAIQMDIQTRFSDTIKEISKLFKEKKYDDIKKEIEKAKYLEKILEEISIKDSHLRNLC